MSEVKGSTGISTGMFVAGLILAILISSTGTYTALSLAGFQGPKGDTGDTGLQGISGNQGPPGSQGPPGKDAGVEADVKASLTSEYHDVWMGTDYRVVRGIIINFGTKMTGNVLVKSTWSYSGGSYSTTKLIGVLTGHEIYNFDFTFYWEGSAGALTWSITWT